MIDLLYCSHNRLEFTKASVETLLANTDWSLVRCLRWHDDGSRDGTKEFMDSVRWPVQSERNIEYSGGPVASMNLMLRDRMRYDRLIDFAKIDSDVLLPPHKLNECLAVMDHHPEVDLLGIECTNDNPEMVCTTRKAEPARHIGGIGIFRARVFQYHGLPVADGRMGFTQFQTARPEILKAWLDPCIPVALLDHLPMEPWRSLSEEYVAKKWQRRGWGEGEAQYYGMKSAGLWDWWAGVRQETAA